MLSSMLSFKNPHQVIIFLVLPSSIISNQYYVISKRSAVDGGWEKGGGGDGALGELVDSAPDLI